MNHIVRKTLSNLFHLGACLLQDVSMIRVSPGKVLVVCFSREKTGQRFDGRDDGSVIDLFDGQLLEIAFGFFPLVLIRNENGGSILCSDVWTLSVQQGWIVCGKKDFQQFAITDHCRVINDPNDLRMACISVADVCVIGPLGVSSGISALHPNDAVHLLENGFCAPETPACKYGFRKPGSLVRCGHSERRIGQLLEVSGFHERDGFAVQTKPSAGRFRSIRKDMPQVGVTAGTQHFGANHAMAEIRFFEDVFGCYGLKEAGPSGSGIEFGIRCKQWKTAAHAGIDSRLFVVEERAAKGALRLLSSGNGVLLRCQLLFPFCIGLDDFRHIDRSDQLPSVVEDAYPNRWCDGFLPCFVHRFLPSPNGDCKHHAEQQNDPAFFEHGPSFSKMHVFPFFLIFKCELITIRSLSRGVSDDPTIPLRRPCRRGPLVSCMVVAMPIVLQTAIMLAASNLFMTFAWYAHLKNMNGNKWYIAALLSWGIALFEYLIQVPANRIGYTAMSLPQLKILQEVITLSVFAPFAIFYMHHPLKLDYLWAGLCLMGAVYFIFRS